MLSNLTVVALELADTKSKSNPAFSILPLILIFGVAYFLLIRPARRRQRAALENRSAVVPGAEVTTTAGLLATVVSVDDSEDVVVLEIAPGVQARFVKGAIARVHNPLEPEPSSPDQLTGEHEALPEPTPEPDSDTGTPTKD